MAGSAPVRPESPWPCAPFSFDELQVGMRETLLRTVMETTVNQFAEVSGDVNPIHLSDDYAANTRFGQRIAHGLYTASLISAVIGTRLPGPGAVYLSQTLNFKAPVRIGDTVVAAVTVSELIADRLRVKLLCTCTVEDTLVLEGD